MPTENTLIEGEAHISPIATKFIFLSNYLVEFRDLNESVVTKKLTIWSKAAQKMIHDIKYPLSVVAVKLDTFKMKLSKLTGTENAEIQKDIDVINNEIKRVNVITKSFLKFSDLEKPNFQAVNVKRIVNSCVKRYDGFINENLKIKIYVDNDVEDIWADEQQIELLFHNLLENSIDALKGEGLITISATLAQYLDNGLSRMVEFEIADTGPGIDQEIRERIFQPYITTKTDGTGVGLSIAKKIIEDHQGQIGFYSKENFGTVVRFSIKVPQV